MKATGFINGYFFLINRFIPREEKHKKYLIVKSISDGGSCWTKNIGRTLCELFS